MNAKDHARHMHGVHVLRSHGHAFWSVTHGSLVSDSKYSSWHTHSVSSSGALSSAECICDVADVDSVKWVLSLSLFLMTPLSYLGRISIDEQICCAVFSQVMGKVCDSSHL